MAIGKEEILEAIENMSVLDLNELVKKFEEKFGILASNVITNNQQGSVIPKVEEEKTEFTVLLNEIGTNKVSVIKAVREIKGLGLKEAKDLVDSAPKSIQEGVDKSTAEATKKKLEEAGAKVEIK